MVSCGASASRLNVGLNIVIEDRVFGLMNVEDVGVSESRKSLDPDAR